MLGFVTFDKDFNYKNKKKCIEMIQTKEAKQKINKMLS